MDSEYLRYEIIEFETIEPVIGHAKSDLEVPGKITYFAPADKEGGIKYGTGDVCVTVQAVIGNNECTNMRNNTIYSSF